MDLNLVVLSGTLSAPPELRQFASGSQLVRYLVTVRSAEPKRRVDVVPVTVWNPEERLLELQPEKGRRIWVAGSVRRRFWEAEQGRRSRLELVAQFIDFPATEAEPTSAAS